MILHKVMLVPMLFVLGGCVSAAGRTPETPPCGGATMVETQLFFGMSRRDGGLVTQDDWDAFVQREVVPRFVEGFAVVETHGFWQDGQSGQTITEPGRMISRMLRPRDDQDIPLIIDSYKKQFDQESVLRIDTRVCAKF